MKNVQVRIIVVTLAAILAYLGYHHFVTHEAIPTNGDLTHQDSIFQLVGYYTLYDWSYSSGGVVVHVTYRGTSPYDQLTVCDPPECCGPKGATFPANLPICLRYKPKGSYDRKYDGGDYKYYNHGTTAPSLTTPVVCP